jgi:hypothetical protein
MSPAPAADDRQNLTRGHNSRSASGDATAARNVRHAAADRSRNVLPGSARRSSNKERRRPRESGPGVVAVAAAAEAAEKSPLRIRTSPLRSNRSRRASRVLPARPRRRARLA